MIYVCGPDRMEKATVVLCEMIAVSVENRDMFTFLQGAKISCKATVTTLPLIKGNILILGRSHPRTSLEASAKLYSFGCVKYQAFVRWSASCQDR